MNIFCKLLYTVNCVH